jgi:hypothetical protein
MHRNSAYLASAIFLAAFLPCAQARAQDLNSVIQKLNTAALGFQNTSANVEYDTVQTDPVPDTDVMKGMAYYERKGSNLQIAAHFTEHNGQPTTKIYTYAGGVFRLSDTGKESDAKVFGQASKYESYLMLGFGASGTELQEKWNVKYLGPDKSVTTDKGAPTDELELVAKDPDIRKNIPKVRIWLDTDRAVSVKQVFDEGQGMSRVCLYTNIKVNQSLPKDAFKFNK